MTSHNRLSGKVAFVTGGGGPIGIGRAACLGLAREGAGVVVAGGRGSEAVAEEVRSAGGRAISVPLDVTDQTSVQAAVDKTLAEFGRLDILFNNAGINRRSLFLDLPISEFNEVLAVNLTGCLICSQIAARAMIERGIRGRIINNSSIYAEESHENYLSYCVSKAALNRLTRSMALELRTYGITVNAIAPGAGAPTNLNRTRLDDWQPASPLPELPPASPDAPPLERNATVWDYLGAVVFLASDEAAFISGTVITIDGGRVAVR